jgi:hypothetical protein
MIKTARSRFILLENLSTNPDTCHLNWDDLLPQEENEEFFESMNNQISFLQTQFTWITIRVVVSVFHISNTTFYKMFPRDSHTELRSPKNRGRPTLVSKEEEKILIDFILEQQQRSDCPSPKECREWFHEKLSNDSRQVLFDRFWWQRFRFEHLDLIATKRVDSRESARAAITKESVRPYIEEIKKAHGEISSPDLVINMDESGFIKRYLKGKQKNCVYLKSCPLQPRFLQTEDLNHISIVGAITLSGTKLLPLLLSTRVTLPKEISGSYLEAHFKYFKTPKGYLTCEAMDFWVDSILIPYVLQVKMLRNLPSSASTFLIFDGLKAHCTEHTAEVFSSFSIHVIELPPHSSHLFQPLDLVIFGLTKKEYKNSANTKSKFAEKITRKIERIIKAWEKSCFRGNILAGWEAAGFKLTFTAGEVSSMLINETSMMIKLN